MKVIVAGLGVQGYKRRLFANTDVAATVDPENPEADYKSIEDIPLTDYDAALLCVPDEPKVDLLRYLIDNGKHALVEKPMWAAGDQALIELQDSARDKGVVCYTAYNHRFEPHFVRMRDLIASGELGEIYRCRMFYGNGTARLVRNSEWRDKGAGVLPDLGSHLLDTQKFWFGDTVGDWRVVSANCFENRALDHVVLDAQSSGPRVELEMTLLMWRNHFTCDVLAENGTAHIRSLCKWGPSTFTKRARILPAGRPPENSITLTQEDPTWALEYAHFVKLCENGVATDMSHDIWLNRTLRNLGDESLKAATE
jgi:scyllo-inositol 2-dehydrogenase (NADP+)